MIAGLIISVASSVTAGAVAAQFSAPLASDWRARKGAMKRRLLAIAAPPLQPARRVIGAAILAALLATGSLAAYAAQPSAAEPDTAARLAAHAAGVVGSGDQLALRLVEDSNERTIRPGDDYADGWKLEKLTPTAATLIKDGQRREVGLNPTGALARAEPAPPPSKVTIQLSDEELLAEVIKLGEWDGKTPRANLTLAETRRWFILGQKNEHAMNAYIADIKARAQRAGMGRATVGLTAGWDSMLYFLGPDGPEYAQLLDKQALASNAGAVAAFNRYGPIQVAVGPPQLDAPDAADGRITIYPELAKYPDAVWSLSRPGAPGGQTIATMRLPDPAGPKLYSNSPMPTSPGLTYYYKPLDSDPNDHMPGVVGPEPPP